MSEAQKLIADVMRQHHSVTELQLDGTRLYHCGRCCGDKVCLAHSVEEYREHLAAEIDTALGGLTRQWATGYGYPCPSAGDFVAVDTFRTRDEAKAQSDRVMASTPGLVRREGWSWVSGWSEEKP